jgi:hypothetical protein
VSRGLGNNVLEQNGLLGELIKREEREKKQGGSEADQEILTTRKDGLLWD